VVPEVMPRNSSENLLLQLLEGFWKHLLFVFFLARDFLFIEIELWNKQES
jgi:hypothetical protein